MRSAAKDHTGQPVLDTVMGAMNTQNNLSMLQGRVINFRDTKTQRPYHLVVQRAKPDLKMPGHRFMQTASSADSTKIVVMSNTSHICSAIAQDTPLIRALEQNETIQEIVDQSATELAVIHAVLKQEIPGHVQTGEVAHALQRTDALETIINGTVHELAQVNEVLAQEIDERADLELELAATKAALVQARHQTA